LLSVVHGSHSSISVCMFSLLLRGFLSPLQLVLGDCSAGMGCFHINRLGVARERSHNKHFGGKNSGKWQVSKNIPPFLSTSVRRTLLGQLQNRAHSPSLLVAGNWVIGFSFSHREIWSQICTPLPEQAGKSLHTLPLIPCNSCMLFSNPHSLHGQLETDSLGNLKFCLKKNDFYSLP